MKVIKLLLLVVGLSIFQVFGMEQVPLASQTFIDQINEKIRQGDEAGIHTFLKNNPQLNWLNVYAYSCASHPDIKMPFDFAVERLCHEPQVYNTMVSILYVLHDHAYKTYTLGKSDFEFFSKFIRHSQALHIVANCNSPRKGYIEKIICTFFDPNHIQLVKNCREVESVLGHLSVDSSCLVLEQEPVQPHSLPQWSRPEDDFSQGLLAEKSRRELSIPLPLAHSDCSEELTVSEPPFVQALRLAATAKSSEERRSHCAMAKILFHCNKESLDGGPYIDELRQQRQESDLSVLLALADMGITKAIEAIQEIHCRN